MKGSTRFLALAPGVLVLLATIPATAPAVTSSRAPVAAPQSAVSGHLARQEMEALALPFLPNQGQEDARVAFYAPLPTGTVFVTHEGEIVYGLPPKGTAKGATQGTVAPVSKQGWTLTERLVTTSHLAPKAAGKEAARVNYFIGRDRAHWQHGLPTYGSVSLGEAWPGIEVSLAAHADNVETFYRLEAGADVERIRMQVSGAKVLKIEGGQLLAETGLGPVAFESPKAWQEIGGAHRTVEVHYALHGDEYGFTLGAHDAGAPVIIDPNFVATYLGGSWTDYGYALALDSAGDVYVAGMSGSSNFPGTTGGFQSSSNTWSAFVAKLTPDLSTLDQATYLGGSNVNGAYAIALDPAGDVYVTGYTQSSDFPGTTGGAQSAYVGTSGGAPDVFVAKLSSDLTTLDQATYLGGSSTDQAYAIALDAAGDVYVAGTTASADFPGTTGGAQASFAGWFDVFVAKLNPGLTRLEQATYLGGTSEDIAEAITLDPAGDVYITGFTISTNLPDTAGAAQSANHGGNSDAFVAMLNPGLTSFDQVTYLGGSGYDAAYAIALDAAGNVYVAGSTSSADFPGIAGGAQSASGGGTTDGFVAKLDPGLTVLDQATYLGGSSAEDGYGLALDAAGDVYVAGDTKSTDLPGTAFAAQSANGGGYDFFVAKLNPGLTSLDQATYAGGTDSDYARALALDPAGDVYVAGYSQSTITSGSSSFPGTGNGAQFSSGSIVNAVVAKLPADLKAQVRLVTGVSAPAQVVVGTGFSYDLGVAIYTVTSASGLVLTDNLPAGVSYVASSASQGSCSDVGATVTCNLGNLSMRGREIGTATATITVRATAVGVAIDNVNIQANQGFVPTSITSAQADTSITPDPLAIAGSVTTTPNTTVGGRLSATTIYTGQALTFSIVSNPLHGTVKLNAATGVFSYIPTNGYMGGDSFSFEATGADGLVSNTATESVTVADIAPKASNTSIQAYPGWTVGCSIAISPGYPGQTLTYSIVTPPAHGTVTITNAHTGTCSYKARAGYKGSDSFGAQAVDQWGTPSSTAVVSVTVL